MAEQYPQTAKEIEDDLASAKEQLAAWYDYPQQAAVERPQYLSDSPEVPLDHIAELILRNRREKSVPDDEVAA